MNQTKAQKKNAQRKIRVTFQSNNLSCTFYAPFVVKSFPIAFNAVEEYEEINRNVSCYQDIDYSPLTINSQCELTHVESDEMLRDIIDLLRRGPDEQSIHSFIDCKINLFWALHEVVQGFEWDDDNCVLENYSFPFDSIPSYYSLQMDDFLAARNLFGMDSYEMENLMKILCCEGFHDVLRSIDFLDDEELSDFLNAVSDEVCFDLDEFRNLDEDGRRDFLKKIIDTQDLADDE